MATIDILIPTYNGQKYLKETLDSVLKQSYRDFRVILCDDASTDNTLKIAKSIKDPRLFIVSNKKNLGYSLNLQRANTYATAKFLYLLGQDDILAQDALKNTIKAFKLSKEIGAVTRPYFWFDKDIKIPVRAKKQINDKKDTVLKYNGDLKEVRLLFDSLDQLSGLAFRRQFMDLPFHPDIFPCHIYPFASIFKKHPVVFLKDYNVAVRIASSQTRYLSSIYQKSPLLSWVEMVNKVYAGKRYQKISNFLIKSFITKNYVGLVQLKNYASFSGLLREIYYLVKFNWTNLFNLSYWFFSLGCIIVPPSLLIPLVDCYKNKILSLSLKDIKFDLIA